MAVAAVVPRVKNEKPERFGTHQGVCVAEGNHHAGRQPLSVPEASAQGDSSASGGVVAQASGLAKNTLVCENGTGRWRAFTAMAEPCRKIVVMVKGIQFHSRH